MEKNLSLLKSADSSYSSILIGTTSVKPATCGNKFYSSIDVSGNLLLPLFLFVVFICFCAGFSLSGNFCGENISPFDTFIQ